MTKHKVAELEGELLDAAVALALGWKRGGIDPLWHAPMGDLGATELHERPHAFSTDWRHGGRLIEHERINITHVAWPNCVAWAACGFGNDPAKAQFRLPKHERYPIGAGPTVLIAVCRAYVAAKLGDEVELP